MVYETNNTMKLPDLPKQNKHKEADFGLKFRKWIDENPMASSSFELKDTRGKDYFNFEELGDDQINHALRNKGKKGNLMRITVGTVGAPDYVYLRNAYAFVVIKYPRFFCLIEIETFLLEKKRSKRKSLTSVRAKEIAWVIA